MAAVKERFVVSLDSDGRPEVIGGPYPPIDAREIRDSFRRHVERGDYSSWNIPRETEKLVSITSGILCEINEIHYTNRDSVEVSQ